MRMIERLIVYKHENGRRYSCFSTCAAYTCWAYSEKLERKDLSAAQTLKSAVSKVENSHPGFLYDLVMGLVKQADLSVNMAESLLKLQGSVPDCE
ncbi:uncharacterized protein CEXT_461961, partial [Caerostris extrusa]